VVLKPPPHTGLQYIILAADNLLILFPTWTQWEFVVLVTILVLPQGTACAAWIHAALNEDTFIRFLPLNAKV
jgi:hypothetical protein